MKMKQGTVFLLGALLFYAAALLSFRYHRTAAMIFFCLGSGLLGISGGARKQERKKEKKIPARIGKEKGI